ncbi:peroxiredoxin (alkyl hydroperoxide reductase subunit C) [Mesobacillus persicus]|nr:peroxiredoxin (alkyl hydroperoxide reductase subunit C) [Mesobacillus persicus]
MDAKNVHATRDDLAPLFSTEALDGNVISKLKLSDFKGKWVILFFYPSNFTSV